jgi:hypothetical protein
MYNLGHQPLVFTSISFKMVYYAPHAHSQIYVHAVELISHMQ